MAPPNLVNFPKLREMTIQKATFAPSKPCTIYFECLESGPNDSARVVRRRVGILRRARVIIFILAYGSFWFQLSVFSSNLTEHHETKTVKPLCIWRCRPKYSNFYRKPRPPLTNEDVLNLDSAPSEPSNSSQSGHTGTNVPSCRPTEHVIKGGNWQAPNFANFGRGYFRFCSTPGQKIGCYGLGSTSATIVAHFLRV
jgi:hypothetical protein